MRVIEDKSLPNSLKTGLVEGLFEDNGTQLVEHVMEQLVGSIGIRAKRAYEYGKTTYLHGLPSATLLSNSKGELEVQDVLEEILGKPFTLDYYHYGPLNHLHYGWIYLCDHYGYNTVTNELTVLSQAKGFTVYLHDLQVMVVDVTDAEEDDGSLSHWGSAPTSGVSPLRPVQRGRTRNINKHTPYGVDPSAANDYFRLTYIWRDALRVVRTEQITFDFVGDITKEYFQVKCSWEIPGPVNIFGRTALIESKYWTYQDGLGMYPVLDNVFHTKQEHGGYFPFIYFRYNKASTGDDVTSQEYKQSKKLTKYLGMDYGTLSKAINDNPDINDITSVFMMMGVPANSTEELECRYLYSYFENLYFGKEALDEKLVNFAVTTEGEAPAAITRYSLLIQDAKFKVAVTLEGIYKKYVKGTLPDGRTYASGYGERTRIENTIVYVDETDLIGTPFSKEITCTCHYYLHQVGEGLYEEIQVDGLSLAYHIEGGYVATGKEGKKNLLIPLEYILTEKYSIPDKELLYARSLHYIFNAKIVTKLKWYQQGWFQIVVFVVSVAIAWFTGYFDPGALGAYISAATSSFAAFFSMVLIPMLKSLVLKFVLKVFVKAVGPQAAMLLAAVAACYGLYDDSFSLGTAGSPWATSLLKVATSMIEAVNETVADAMQELTNEYTAFVEYKEEATKLLAEHQKLLETSTLLNPAVIWGQSPTAYFDTTIHNTNPGVLCFGALENYVDMALTLPDINQTMKFTT